MRSAKEIHKEMKSVSVRFGARKDKEKGYKEVITTN